MKTSSKIKGVSSRIQAGIWLGGSGKQLPLSNADRAFATKMYREAVIWQKRLDFALSRYVKKSVDSLDEPVLNSLRIGAVQLMILGTPAHAAVSATVEAHTQQKTRGLINAVLRKIASHKEKDLPLHIKYSHPEKLVTRWVHRYGNELTEKLLIWNNSSPSLGGYSFKSNPENSKPGLFLNKYRLLERQGAFTVPTGFYIQDEATAIVGRGMAELPGTTVLEIGAAPGGKTAHLNGTGIILAVDKKRKRLNRWLQNRDRLNWQNCFPLTANSSMLPFKDSFDKVIVDAPCTNTGVYKRRFDARWNWSEKLENELVLIQRDMLEDSAKAVKPGGILVYSTCSIEPAENIETVRYFEERNSLFQRIDFPAPDKTLTSQGFLSIFPPEHQIDGLFAACWRRTT